MKESTSLETVINDDIGRELVQGTTRLPLAVGKPPLEAGVLGSLSLLRPAPSVHDRFGIVVDDLGLVPEHFRQRGRHLRLPAPPGRGKSRTGKRP
jgi:hypothetical protein